MKIAILHYSNSIIDLNKIFGMQRMELNELRELEKIGVEATLYAKDIRGEHSNVKKIPYNANDKHLFDLPYYTRFVDMNKDVDILQGNATPLLAAFQPKKTLLRFDGPVDFPMANNAAILEAYKKANYIFVSKHLKNYFLSRYPFIPNKKAHVLYNAVDYSEQVSKQTNQKMRLLFCSRWVGYKGFYVLLDALKLLEKKRDDYEVFIAGGIHSTSRSNDNVLLEEKIRNKIDKIKNVKVIGYVPHNELKELFNKTDILLFPSLWDEPFGLVPAEAAMACTPTIAFSVGALPEVVIHNETGVLIKKSKYDFINARRLSNEIYNCLDNPVFVRKLGNNARTRCVNEFNWHIYMQKLLGIYKKITDNNE